VEKGVAEEIIRELSILIPRHLGGSIFSAILSRERSAIEFRF